MITARSRNETAEQWFDRLYEATSDDLLAFLVRRARTLEDAADALAETYAAAWRKLDSLPAGDGARLWLFGAARNELRKTTSGRRADEELSARISSDSRTWWEEGPEAEGPDDGLRDALAALSRLDREIITLTAWEELTPREIAAVLGLSANVVRIRLHRARGKLRALLKREQRLETRPATATQH